jgi:hypothetical protein
LSSLARCGTDLNHQKLLFPGVVYTIFAVFLRAVSNGLPGQDLNSDQFSVRQPNLLTAKIEAAATTATKKEAKYEEACLSSHGSLCYDAMFVSKRLVPGP